MQTMPPLRTADGVGFDRAALNAPIEQELGPHRNREAAEISGPLEPPHDAFNAALSLGVCFQASGRPTVWVEFLP